MQPTAVSLDFDDTLILSEAVKKSVLLEVASSVEGGAEAIGGVNTDARVSGVKCTRHTIFRDLAMELSKRGLCREPVELGRSLAARYSAEVEPRLRAAPEVPGARALLEHLQSNGVPTFINSATPQAALERVVRERGWDQLVRGVLGAPEEGGDKVDNLERIAEACGVRPECVVHVGDGDNDAAAAKRFGCAFIRVGEQVKDMLEASVELSRLTGIPPPLDP